MSLRRRVTAPVEGNTQLVLDRMVKRCGSLSAAIDDCAERVARFHPSTLQHAKWNTYLKGLAAYREEKRMCAKCDQIVPQDEGIGTGFAILDNGDKICYACTADLDRAYMKKMGEITLYLVENEDHDKIRLGNAKNCTHFITNWPASLKFPCYRVKEGRHNLAGKRYDAWFMADGDDWHGTSYGDNTQIIRCKRKGG